MLTIFIRAILLYVVLMLTMRAMGKRQLGQFQPYEFVMVMLIANLVSTPMSDVSTPLLTGLLPVAALFIVHTLITLACMRSDRMRALLSGTPPILAMVPLHANLDMLAEAGIVADPAERTWTWPWAWWSRRAAAIWLRPALWTQTNRTSGTSLVSRPSTCASAARS